VSEDLDWIGSEDPPTPPAAPLRGGDF
jgi:hypothetical protein